MILNWNVYSTTQELNYGFGTTRTSFFLIVHSFGLIVIILLWLIVYSKDLRYKISSMKENGTMNKDQSESTSQIADDWNVSLNEKLSNMQKQIEELREMLKKAEIHKSEF
jgi:hypothetical protein